MPRAQQGMTERVPAGADRLLPQSMGARLRSVDLRGEFNRGQASVHGRLLGLGHNNLGPRPHPGNDAPCENILQIAQRRPQRPAPTIAGWTS